MALLQLLMKLPWSEEQKALHSVYLVLLIFIPSLFILKFINRSAKKPNLPPSPPKLPFIGNLHQVGTLPHRSLRVLSHKYGPIMRMQLGSSPILVVSSTEILEEMIKKQDIVFSGRGRMAVGEKLFFGWSDMYFAPYGEYWTEVKKFCMLELLSVKKVQSFKSVRDEVVGIMIDRINHLCQMGRNSVNLTDLLGMLSTNLMLRVALGGKCQGEDYKESKVWQMSREMAELFGTFSMRDFFPLLGWIDRLRGLNRREKKTSKELDAFFDQVIQEHLMREKNDQQPNLEDFVDLLLRAQKESTSFTHNNIKAILLDMLIGGSGTVAITVGWAMAELIRNPRVMKKAQEEVRRLVGKKSKVEEDDIYQMDYLKCIIKETLRLYPPGPLLTPRECTRATEVKGYHIPSKTQVFVNAWAIQRDSKLWDNPEEFIPERFINSPLDFRGQDFKYIPFGMGRRSCPGMIFGLASFESILGNLLYWYDWELPRSAEREVDMTESSGILLYKKKPLHLLPKFHPF